MAKKRKSSPSKTSKNKVVNSPLKTFVDFVTPHEIKELTLGFNRLKELKNLDSPEKTIRAIATRRVRHSLARLNNLNPLSRLKRVSNRIRHALGVERQRQSKPYEDMRYRPRLIAQISPYIPESRLSFLSLT